MVNYTNIQGNMTQQFEYTISSGFQSMAGDQIVLAVIGILIMLGIGYYKKADTEVIVLSVLTMFLTIVKGMGFDWLLWLFLIPIGLYAGVIFSRIFHK